MAIKEILKTRYGLSSTKNFSALDSKKLFVKGGISVISSLSGEGKTTKMIQFKKELEAKNYEVSYINFDNSPTYDSEMIEAPNTKNEVENFLKIIEQNATKVDVIIIDSLKAMAGVGDYDIKDNNDMYSLFNKFRTITKQTDCSIILVHHITRAKNVKTHIDNIYGTRGIEEVSDSVFLFYGDRVIIIKSRLGHRRDQEIFL